VHFHLVCYLASPLIALFVYNSSRNIFCGLIYLALCFDSLVKIVYPLLVNDDKVEIMGVFRDKTLRNTQRNNILKYYISFILLSRVVKYGRRESSIFVEFLCEEFSVSLGMNSPVTVGFC
jgi:hypothetical protein